MSPAPSPHLEGHDLLVFLVPGHGLAVQHNGLDARLEPPLQALHDVGVLACGKK